MVFISSLAFAKTIYFNGSDFKDGYYMVPDDIPEGSKLWVMVDVHGAGGLRKEKPTSVLTKLVAPEPVIVIVPSFTTGYQSGSGKWAAQLVKNFKAVQKSYKVHDKMFIHGHSGGSQFAHRFAFTNSKYVIGVSAHSSGSWATGGQFGSISTRAKSIPFTISCGEKDTGFSVKGYPHTRIEWYKIFAKDMQKKGFVVAHQTWPNAGHGVSPSLYGPQLKECFDLATKGIKPESKVWAGDVDSMADAARKEYGGNTGGSKLGEKKRPVAIQKMQTKVAAGNNPEQLTTLQFLFKHPASDWAGVEGFQELKSHCKKVAQQYLDDRKENGKPLGGRTLSKFKKATDGLGIEY